MLDDRSQPTQILRSVFEPWPVKDDSRIAQLVRRLNVAIRGEHRFRQLLFIVPAAVISITVIGLFLGTMRRFSVYPIWIAPLVIIVFLVLLSFWSGRKARQWSEPRIVSVILREGLCPCCGYNLHGLDPSGDGCLVCPECGGAWKSDRIWRTAPFDPKAATLPARAAINNQSRHPAWTTRDATRMSVELAPARLRRARRDAPPERAARLVAAWRETARRSRWIRWPVLGTMWGGSAAIMASMTLDDRMDWTGYLVIGVFLAVVCTLATLTNFLYSPRAMRRAMLRRNFCPKCASELRGMNQREPRSYCPMCLTEWISEPMPTSAPPPLQSSP